MKIWKMKTHLFFIAISIYTLSSCINHKTIHRDYKLAQDEECDCLTRRPLIQAGKRSEYKMKEKAFCTNINFIKRKDSINQLNDLLLRLEDEWSGEVLEAKKAKVDSLIQDLKNDWTHLKIKTKWKPSYSNQEIVILKQQLKYYNKFKKGRKYLGKKVIVNDSLVEVGF